MSTGKPCWIYSWFSPSKSTDDPYLDGVCIPVGTPRKHAWNYATGYSKFSIHDGIKVHCPCAKHNGTNPPLFVKEHFYCGSGASDSPDLTTFFCPAGDDCCSALKAPWFYHHFVEASC